MLNKPFSNYLNPAHEIQLIRNCQSLSPWLTQDLLLIGICYWHKSLIMSELNPEFITSGQCHKTV
jgi:hypothetical protein